MESSILLYEDGTFSVELIKAQVAVASKAKILQMFYHKISSADASVSYLQKHKIALPPFVLRVPEEVPLTISLIKEKSEEFRHKFQLTSTLPKMYSDARLAMSILDPEVIRHILSCFTKSKLKEMEDMTKTLTNRHKKRNSTLDKYLNKLDDPIRVPKIVPPVGVKVDTQPVNMKPEVVEEVKVFSKTALVSSGHSTAFRLDTSATSKLIVNKEQDLERFKASRKLKLKVGISINKIHVDDIHSFRYTTNESDSEEIPHSSLIPDIHNNYLSRKRQGEIHDLTEDVEGRKNHGNKERNSKHIRRTSSDKRSKEYETVADIVAQFEPCSQFIVESDRTIDDIDCRLCKEKVYQKVNQTTKNALTAHYRTAHHLERYYQCGRCDLILPSIDVWFLERHKTSSGCKPANITGSQKPDFIKCEKCDQKFDKNSSYRDHYKKSHTDIFKDKYKKKVECGSCGLKFTNQSMLSMHEVYEQKLCKVPCSVCKEMLEVKLNCKLEKMFKVSGLVDSVKCKICS